MIEGMLERKTWEGERTRLTDGKAHRLRGEDRLRDPKTKRLGGRTKSKAHRLRTQRLRGTRRMKLGDRGSPCCRNGSGTSVCNPSRLRQGFGGPTRLRRGCVDDCRVVVQRRGPPEAAIHELLTRPSQWSYTRSDRSSATRLAGGGLTDRGRLGLTVRREAARSLWDERSPPL